MTAGLSVRPTPAACRISTASPILFHPSLITVFRVVPTLVSHENGSQYTRVSSLAGMEVEPSTWYSSRDTHPSIDPAHWRLTSQPCLCSNHHSTWSHCHDSETIFALHTLCHRMIPFTNRQQCRPLNTLLLAWTSCWMNSLIAGDLIHYGALVTSL